MVARVGDLRVQAALQASDTPVIVVTHDPELTALVAGLRVSAVYPDQADNGTMSVFKIELSKKE